MSYRALIADDEDSVRRLIARVCEKLGWEVDVARDGNEALGLMKCRSHDVFVFDMKMPGLSGLELARRVSEYEQAPAVLLITGYPEVDTAVEAMRAGVLDYVQKPIETGQLRDLLIRATKYHESCLRSLRARREREETVRNIEEANERFRAMLELSRDVIFLLSARTGRIIDCNATACERLRYTRQELLRMSLTDVEDLSPCTDWETLANRIRDAQSLVIEGAQRSKNGDVHPVELSLSLACLTSGEYVAAVARDITERKRVQVALEQARSKAATEAAKLRSIIESMEEGVVFADESDIITEVNDWFLDVVKMPREMVLGASIWDFHGGEVGRGFRGIVEDFRARSRNEGKVVNRDFMGRPVSIRIQPIFYEGGYRGMILNVTAVQGKSGVEVKRA
jgi:PAS domain S-box-containing protein